MHRSLIRKTHLIAEGYTVEEVLRVICGEVLDDYLVSNRSTRGSMHTKDLSHNGC